MKAECYTNKIGISVPKKYAKYADLWYLRDLDALPESLAIYINKHKPGQEFFSAVDHGEFFVYKSKEEAMVASCRVRRTLKDGQKTLFEKAVEILEKEKKVYSVGTLSEEGLELQSLRAELAYVKTERDEARKEVDRRNTRVHQLQIDKDVLTKLCLELYNCSSWWKRILHRKKIHTLMMEVYNHTSDVYLFSIAQRITFIDRLFSSECEE